MPSPYFKPVGYIAGAIAAVAIGIGVWQTVPTGGGTPPPPPGTANLWIDSNGGTCARSATPLVYNDATACSTLQTAFTAANGGDLVLIKAGNYPAQSLTGTKASNVTMQAAAGEAVKFGVTTTATVTPTGVSISASDVTLQDIGIPFWDYGGSGPTILKNIDGDTYTSTGSNLTVDGGDYGPYNPPCSGGSSPLHDNPSFNAGSNIVVQHGIYHDMSTTNCPGSHIDCFQVAQMTGMVVNGNKFLNCFSNGAIFTGDFGVMNNIQIINNWFGPTTSGNRALNWNATRDCPGSVVSYNTFIVPGDGNNNMQVVCSANSSTVMTGNIMSLGNSFECGGAAMKGVVTYSVISSGTASQCGTNAVQGNLNLVNSPASGSPYLSYDYHLGPGSVAIGRGNPASMPATDIDCGTRTATTDAGSDQRSATGTCTSSGTTVGPVTAANSGLVAAPTSVAADNLSTSTLTATLRDASNNPVSGKTVTLAKGSGSSTITTISGLTDSSGQATFTVKDATPESTTYTATDVSDSLVVTQTAAVTFTTVVTGQRFVSTTGTNTGTCTSVASPCLTLNYAYGQATLGDTISMANGTYANQNITGTKTGSGVVTIQPASGATVTVPLLDTAGGNHIVYSGINTTRYTASAAANDITWNNVSTGSFFITNATNLNIIGGNVGPWDANALGLGEDPEIGTQTSPQPNNILIQGVTFHDVLNTSDPTAHADCMQFTSGTNVTIQNNKFYNCGNDADVYIRGDFGPVSNFLIQNNFFGASQGFFSLRLSGQSGAAPVCTNFLIRNNSGLRGAVNASGGTGDEMWGDCTAAGANGVVWLGNVSGSTFSGDCSTSTGVGQVWSFNDSIAGTACTGTSNTVGVVNYVNGVNTAAIDLHLTGATGNADNKLTPGQNFAPVDIDGVTRPIGANADLGADER